MKNVVVKENKYSRSDSDRTEEDVTILHLHLMLGTHVITITIFPGQMQAVLVFTCHSPI